MHVVRTPLVGIGFAFVLLLVETLGLRAFATHAQADRARTTYQRAEDEAIAAVRQQQRIHRQIPIRQQGAVDDHPRHAHGMSNCRMNLPEVHATGASLDDL